MVGAKIRILRTSAGWSQAELAQKAKIGLATVSRIERDSGNPTRASLEAVAKVLGTSFESLMGETRQEELVQVGQMHAALERMTEQLDGLIQAHADLKQRLETFLQLRSVRDQSKPS